MALVSNFGQNGENWMTMLNENANAVHHLIQSVSDNSQDDLESSTEWKLECTLLRANSP